MSTVIGAAIIDLKADTSKLVTGMDRAEKTIKNSIDRMKKNIKDLAIAYLGFKGFEAIERGLESIIRTGISYNRSLENLTNGLTTLAVATSENETVTGKAIDITKKYTLANIEAKEAIEKLTKINAQTPHTLNQTVEIYKAMYASMKKAGVSTDEMIELTKKLSIVAGSAGIDFNQLLAGVDGLATGTVMANSELGRLLSSLGLTNEVLKNSSDKFATINEKLKDVKAIDSFDIAISNATNSFNILAGEISKPIFENLKEDIKDTTSFLDNLTNSLREYKVELKNVSEVETNEIDLKIKTLLQKKEDLKKQLKEDDGFLFFGLTDNEKEIIKNNIDYIDTQIRILQNKQKKAFVESGERLKANLENTTEVVKKNIDKTQKIIKGFYEESREYSNPIADISTIEEHSRRKAEAYLSYYNTIGAYSSEWELKEKDIRDKYTGLLSPEEIDELVAKYKSDFFKPLKDMSKDTAGYMERIFDTMDKSLTRSFDSFFDYTSQGFMKFGDLASAVLHDIYMEIMRASVINPMVSGIMSGLTSLFTPSNVAPNLALSLKGYASGDVFGATPFATGGAFTNSIVTEPTFFAYGDSFGGNLGVMGEAGAEAVMPLTRIGSDLGVKSTPSNVVINVENQSGTPVDMKKVDEFINDDGTRTINIVMNAIERNPDFRDAIKGIR